MTEQEARQKAEAWADKYRPADRSAFNIKLYAEKAYMQCYRDLTSGPADGWCAWHPEKGLCVETFDLNQKDSARYGGAYVGRSYIDQGPPEDLGNGKFDERLRNYEFNWELAMNDGWRIVPVRLLEVKEK